MSVDVRFAVIFWVSAVTATAAADDLELASYFGDGMVLQRDAPIVVTGRGEPLTDGAVRLGDEIVPIHTDAEGAFRAELSPRSASSEGRPLRVALGDTERVLGDVLVGDVFVFSGQSNMELPLGAATWGAALARASDPQVRVATVGRRAAREAEHALASPLVWATLDAPGVVDQCSAIAAFAAVRLRESLGVPIGVVGASAGSSPIEAWIPVEDLELLPEGELALSGGAAANEEDYFRRSALFNAMLAPLTAMSISGLVFYQGESHAFVNHYSPARDYEALLRAFVRGVRHTFDAPWLPVFIVQLPEFGDPSALDRGSLWARVRDAQRRATDEEGATLVATLGVARGADTGIHPPNKAEFGARVADAILHEVYAERATSAALLPAVIARRQGELTLELAGVVGALSLGDAVIDDAFECEVGGVAAPATVTLQGSDVHLSCSDAPGDLVLRYGFADEFATAPEGGDRAVEDASGTPLAAFEVVLPAEPDGVYGASDLPSSRAPIEASGGCEVGRHPRGVELAMVLLALLALRRRS